MAQYLRLASAIATLKQAPSTDLITRVIRTADRWRALDPDKTEACQSAARVFLALNVRELAWDYMTTPLAEKSNEGQPWVNLAQLLRQEGDFPLADRAYATAFDVEPTNAQNLWDRAMLLQQMEHLTEARKLFQQLADGKWEPRFSWIQTQARNYVQSH
jgi:tetratricopeptide (TPR) repeat protein